MRKGTIDWVDTDEGETLWHVTYQDFDEEQLTREELSQVIRCHPLLHTTGDLKKPKVRKFVWYAVNQQPRLEQVMAVDPTVPRPVMVEVFEPQSNAESLARASFCREVDSESGDQVTENITLHQIQLAIPSLTTRGFLSQRDRRRLQRCLKR